jgi:hypothetical protein
MARYKTLNTLEPDELTEVMGFIDLLKDADKYKAQVEELESRKQEINDLIHVLGDVNDIENLRSSAYARNEESTRFRDEAFKIREDAEEYARKKRKDATDDSDAIIRTARTDFSTREETLRESEKGMARREAEDVKRDADLKHREELCADATDRAELITEKYTQAVASLRTSIEETAKAL